MTTASNKVVMYGSDEAAQLVTVTAWRSRTGALFVGHDAEHMARRSGATHISCRHCGQGSFPVMSLNECRKCRKRIEWERYQKLPEVAWDGSWPLMEDSSDTYLWNEDDFWELLENAGSEAGEGLMLRICLPNNGPQVEALDLLADDLLEDVDDIHPDIEEAVKALNAAISKHAPFSWHPGKSRVDGHAIARRLKGGEA